MNNKSSWKSSHWVNHMNVRDTTKCWSPHEKDGFSEDIISQWEV